LNATESGIFSKLCLFRVVKRLSKPSFCQILYIYVLVRVFSEDNVTVKT